MIAKFLLKFTLNAIFLVGIVLGINYQ